MNEKGPKIFISYSWTCAERVIELAERLMRDGVDVILDKWELKEGQDKLVFMERSVTDQSIDKVLMICDKAYTEKANDRQGGVGDETMVISPEVYAKATETKFIPVIFERDNTGKECVPAYLKSRIYVDLCENNPQIEHEYEKLLRNLHEKSEYKKPPLGKMPEWLNDDDIDFSALRHILRQLHSYGDNKAKVSAVMFATRKFFEEFISAFSSLSPKNNEEFNENLLRQIDIAKPLRDLYFDFLEIMISWDVNAGEVAGDFFEQVFNESYVLNGRNSYSENEFEFNHFIIWEAFVGTTALFLHYEKYHALESMLHRTYFLKQSPTANHTEPSMFCDFHPRLLTIEGVIRNSQTQSRRLTLAGDIVIKREKLPLIKQSTLANADVVLYQLSCVYGYSDSLYYHQWFPKLYVFLGSVRYEKQDIWAKMISKRHCEKLYPLFGVTDLEQLRIMVSRNQPDDRVRYPNSFESAPAILQSIPLDKIGTMP